MFLGHYAAALVAKRAVPAASLGALVAAAQLPDLLWPVFLLLGWERVELVPGDTAFTPLAFVHYPWSHSLALIFGWAATAAAAARAATGRRDIAVAVGFLVVSHWVLDVVAHRPDLPLWPSGPQVGLGLWHSVAATLIVELVFFAGASTLAFRAVRRGRPGRTALLWFLGLLLLTYLGNILGPPPPSAATVAWAALALWLLVPWAAWLDRRSHRREIDETRTASHT